jgi:hypothetical protein
LQKSSLFVWLKWWGFQSNGFQFRSTAALIN